MGFSVDHEVLRGFQQEVRGYLPILRGGLAAGGGAGEALDLAGAIRGAASILGLAELRDAAANIERALAARGGHDPAETNAALALIEEFGLVELPDGGRPTAPADSPPWPEEPDRPAPAEGPEPADEIVSADLLEIFQAEAEEHLGAVAEHLRRLEDDPNQPARIQEVRRSVHTLKGAAGMVGLRTAARLAHRAEDYLDLLFDRRARLTPDALRLLQKTADALEDLARAGAATDELRNRVNDLRAGFDALVAADRDDLSRLAEAVAPPPEASAAPDAPARPVPPPPPPAEPRPEAEAAAAAADHAAQYARVPLERIDELVRLVSELVVHRSALEQHYARYRREIGEHDLTVGRLRRLAAHLEDEVARRTPLATTFAAGRGFAGAAAGSAAEFDELEFDRYNDFHLLSRDLTETAADLGSAGVQLRGVGEDFRQALHRFGRVTAQVQDRLIKLRMSPIGSIDNRLHRTVRVAAERRGKLVRFEIEGADVELDKTLVGEVAGALEHILRNAVDHGIEPPEERARLGKSETGLISLEAALEGHRAVLRVRDDGRGLDAERLRRRAVELGRCSGAQVAEFSDDEVREWIFQPGFSTASEVSEISGRGVGLDAVRATVLRLGGSVSVQSSPGRGTTFTIGLPTSLAVARVLTVECAGRTLCLPAHAVEKVSRAWVERAEGERRPSVEIDGRRLPVFRLADALGLEAPDGSREMSVLAVDAGERRYALAVDGVGEARDAVVKSLGPLLENTPGISAATVLGDGSVSLILSPAGLPDAAVAGAARLEAAEGPAAPGLHVLIADDSLSVRRVLMRTFEAAGWRCTAARDGQEALDLVRSLERPPDVALLDVEMPRMDGFELTAALRADPLLAALPIVMLTSRAGDKHRAKAAQLGADDYLVKPYQDDVLLAALRRAARRRQARPA